MTGAARGRPDTAGTDPLTAVVAEVIADGLTRLRITGKTTDGKLVVNADAIATTLATAVVAAVRSHQNTTGQQTAARAALGDAADTIETHARGPQNKGRKSWGNRGWLAGMHEAAKLLRARADALDAAGYDDHKTVPRCQHTSPSPWGLTQCALPHGHDGRHAYSPSETAAILSGDTGGAL